jgi:hypothetical protein
MATAGPSLKEPWQHIVLTDPLAESGGREVGPEWNEAIDLVMLLIPFAHLASLADSWRHVQVLEILGKDGTSVLNIVSDRCSKVPGA